MSKEQKIDILLSRVHRAYIDINYRIIFGLAHFMIVSWDLISEGDAFGRGSLYPSQILFF